MYCILFVYIHCVWFPQDLLVSMFTSMFLQLHICIWTIKSFVHECIDSFLPSTRVTTQGVQGIAVVLGFLPLLLVTREELRM